MTVHSILSSPTRSSLVIYPVQLLVISHKIFFLTWILTKRKSKLIFISKRENRKPNFQVMTLLGCHPPLCNCSTLCAVDLCVTRLPRIFFATIFMLLSLLCHYWPISLLCCLWHSSIGFWHNFNGKSTKLSLHKMNIPSVSEILSTCSSLNHPISSTLLSTHHHSVHHLYVHYKEFLKIQMDFWKKKPTWFVQK